MIRTHTNKTGKYAQDLDYHEIQMSADNNDSFPDIFVEYISDFLNQIILIMDGWKLEAALAARIN